MPIHNDMKILPFGRKNGNVIRLVIISVQDFFNNTTLRKKKKKGMEITDLYIF